eukprot:14688584-Ditylum_brightwellii.AAC.1
MKDWITLGKYTGFCLSEWVQEEIVINRGLYTTSSLSEGGNGSSKAFILDNFKMFADNSFNINNN